MTETLTINIESSGIRATVTRGRNIIRWAEAPLPKGTVTNGVVTDPDGTAEVLKGLLVSLKVGRARPVVSVSGVRSFFRCLNVPKMERALLDKAVLHDLEDSVHVPQDQWYITWTRMRGIGEGAHIFVVASPRETVDSIIQTVRASGLKMPVMDSKPLALARLAGKRDAIIVDIEADIFHFVLVKSGCPMVIRTVPLGNSNVVELPEQLREELDTTITLYQESFADNPIATDVPVLLSGAETRLIKSMKSVSDYLQRPVESVSGEIKHLNDTPWPALAVNAGMALRQTWPLLTRQNLVPEVDILPLSYQPAPRPVKQMVLGPVVAAGIVMVAFAYQMYEQAAARNELAVAEIKVIQKEMMKRQAESKKLNDLEQTLALTEASLRTMLIERNTLVPGMPQFVGSLTNIYSQAGDQIVLSMVNQNGGRILINGAALDHRAVVSYADRMIATKAFSKVAIRESSMIVLTGEELDIRYRFGSGDDVRILAKGDSVTRFVIEVTR